jgi:hypothetical protein
MTSWNPGTRAARLRKLRAPPLPPQQFCPVNRPASPERRSRTHHTSFHSSSAMASLLLRRPLFTTFAVGLTTSSLILNNRASFFPASPFRQPLACEASSGPLYPSDRSSGLNLRRRNGLDADTVRQISTGSILGLVGGVIVGFLSKPLAVILGALVAGNVVSCPSSSSDESCRSGAVLMDQFL